jgi:hypothetical protein
VKFYGWTRISLVLQIRNLTKILGLPSLLRQERKKESSMSPHEALVSWREAPTTQISISYGF